MSQQNQTYNFFKSHAKEWQIKAEDKLFSTIQNRHLAVLETMRPYPTNSSLLDVGCGTGQLAIEASSMNWKSIGLDFAEDMIEIAQNNNKKSGTKANFICESIFDYYSEEKFDVISAQGFIEYISLEQLEVFFKLLKDLINPGGSVSIGSRNRLFNISSLNSFTKLEIELNTINSLVEESIILQESESQKIAISNLRNMGVEYAQPEKHPGTAIKVDTRYQFTPADLINRLEKVGFKVSSIYPVHFHVFPVQLMTDDEVKTLHKTMARHVSENFISAQNLIPYSSSFVIEARIG